MNSTLNQWQTARFSVFARQSRVEINTQKDLEEMLAKLEENNAAKEECEQKKKAAADNRKRRFLELALPSGLLAFLSLVYCLLLLANGGGEIVETTKMNNYLSTLENMELTAHYLIKEHRAKLWTNLFETNMEQYSEACSKTDIMLDNLFTEKSMLVWEILRNIRDWRAHNPQNIIQISEFYLRFEKAVKALVNNESLKTEIKDWKTYYEYQTQTEVRFSLAILLNTLEFMNETSEAINLIINDSYDALVHFTAKFSSLMGPIKNESLNRSIAGSYDILLKLSMTEMVSNVTHWNYIVNDKISLSSLSKELTHRSRIGLEKIRGTSRSSLTSGIIMILLSIVFMGMVTICIVLFVLVFREQIRLVVVVSRWLKHVTSEMDQQKASTDKVMNQLVPRILVHKFDVGQQINMIPYQVSETTLFLISIEGFNEFFNIFASEQVLHILRLVMELIDERMEQYNVFPVSKMGQNLLVVSDSVAQKQVEHACEIANLALDIMTCCSDLEIGRHSAAKLQMKLAIHTGPCSGRLVIHKGTVQLKLTGNTLTVLQTLHKTAIPNMIQVSETTQKLLATCEMYCMRYRGNLKVPGMSQFYKVYWLNGRRVSSTFDRDSVCSRMGSWIELEKRPLYRLVESEGVYEPLNKSAPRRYSQMSVGSFNHLSSRCSSPAGRLSNSPM